MRGNGIWRLGFAGLGNVNRALVRLLVDRRAELRDRWGLGFEITAVSSASRGAWIEPSGIDVERALDEGWSSSLSTLDAIRSAPIDLLFEGTTLDPVRGEPATSYVRAALERGVSVISANKGPVAFAARELFETARRTGAGFRFESAVADCLPILNLFEFALPAGRVTRFEGVLNATSNLVLQAVGRGETREEAIAAVRRLGLAEADPSHDLDGWDQAVKGVILANAIMGLNLAPASVARVPFSAIDIDWVRAEEGAGRTVRLAVTGSLQGQVAVGPVSLEPRSFLASLQGGSLGLILETDLAGTLMVGCVEPQVEQTAYGMLTDLVAVHQGRLLMPSPLAAGPRGLGE